MANIREIDYDQIITKASQIANDANEMQKSIKLAFEKIQSMSNNWFGNSYDNFIDTVNMSITGLNNLFEITVSDIPHEIAAKAKSYAASNQAVASVNLKEQVAIILAKIPITNKGAKLRFKSSEVSTDQAGIKAKFESAKSYADKAKAVAKSLSADWQSISGDTNIEELVQAFIRVQGIIKALSEALDRQISAQITTIDTIERASNNVDKPFGVLSTMVDTAVTSAKLAQTDIEQSATDLWINLLGKN